MKATIQDLKKGNVFKFNDEEFKVRRKFISEEKPLIADAKDGEHRFYHEGLEIELIS